MYYTLLKVGRKETEAEWNDYRKESVQINVWENMGGLREKNMTHKSGSWAAKSC